MVKMDLIIGTVGGKAILTHPFRSCGIILVYQWNANISQIGIYHFYSQNKALGDVTFYQLFSALLDNNSSAFSNPLAIELNKNGKRRTNGFYWTPASSNHKTSIEGAHMTLRKILP